MDEDFAVEVDRTIIRRPLAQSVIDEIAAIGMDRLPNEACGALLTTEHRGSKVVELPNRSNLVDTFAFSGEDLAISLENWAGDWNDIVIWHTHPSGALSPSQGDLDGREKFFSEAPTIGFLVVAFREDGHQVTWY